MLLTIMRPAPVCEYATMSYICIILLCETSGLTVEGEVPSPAGIACGFAGSAVGIPAETMRVLTFTDLTGLFPRCHSSCP